MTTNKQPEWRKALNKSVENYQSAQAWYEENQDSPSAEQDVDTAAGEIEKLLKQYGVLIVLSLLDEIAELQEHRAAVEDKDLLGVIDALEHPAGINAAGKQVVRRALVELQEIRRSYLALRGEIEDVQSQLYEADNQANEYAAELQERRKADSAEPVSFDELNAAVAEVTGGNQHAWDANIYKGHQEVPFMNYNSLARIVDKYRVPQPAPAVPDEKRDDDGSVTSEFDLGWNACRAAMLQAGNSPVAPDGYVLVPVVPTEDMIINGFESVPDPHFSDEKEWEEYEALSGCRQAARRAELCWAAMIKAAPKQENI